jgi:beta-N-acetylhexosaminidase
MGRSMKPVIVGISGPDVTEKERALLVALDPVGFILFKHNIQNPTQTRSLTDQLREISGRQNVPILIDQEGGRVARLSAPVWPQFPAASAFAALYALSPIAAIEAARANAEAIAWTLYEAGINVNCMPVLDLHFGEADNAINGRSLGRFPLQVAALGRAIIDGLASGGVAAVIKHLPGQGRAKVDSHDQLPIIEANAQEMEDDIAPFVSLAKKAKIAMTGHALYPVWDKTHPATFSKTILQNIVRNTIGFEGLLLSDDLHMGALQGTLLERAQAALGAGCDIALACWASDIELQQLSDTLPEINAASHARLAAATNSTTDRLDMGDVANLMAKCANLLAMAA